MNKNFIGLLIKLTTAFAMANLITACGGGSSDSQQANNTTTTTDTPPINVAEDIDKEEETILLSTWIQERMQYEEAKSDQLDPEEVDVALFNTEENEEAFDSLF